jgi:Cu(I)/Ag(I) efflux system protein CusF
MLSMRALCVVVSVTAVSLLVGAEESQPVWGEILKVDLQSGRITIKHGPIESLGITEGESTNDFKPKEPIMLKAVLPGEKIKFRADRVEGQLTLTAIQPPG